MNVIGAVLGLAPLILQIVVPIYLFFQARDRSWPSPWLWIVFGIFQPVLALMLYYLFLHGLPSRG
ncbi:MAG: hypothetical protein GX335_08290 [Firmicutes bacterium]|nr:hypothetical protein [Bacillota bacterium]